MTNFNLSVFDFLFLPVLLVLLAIFSWQDYKKGKISNRYLAIGFLWGTAILILLALWSLVARPASLWWYEKIAHISGDQARPIFSVSYQYLSKVVINLLLTSVLSFAFWRWKVWKAGDAKAVILVSLLLPLEYYQKLSLVFFPSAALFLNIFAVALVWILAKKILLGKPASFNVEEIKKRVDFSKIWASLKTGGKQKLPAVAVSFLALLGLQIAGAKFFPQYASVMSYVPPLLLLLLSRLMGAKSAFWRKTTNLALIVFVLAAAIFFYFNFSFAQPLFLPLGTKMLGYFVIMALVFGLFNRLVDSESPAKMRFALIIFLGTLLTIILKGSFFVLWR